MFSSKPSNEKLLKVFSGIRCLNKDQLPRYLDGRLTDIEKHLVEQHLTDCDLCYEALQALEQEAGQEKYQDLTGKLQRYILESIEPVSHVQKMAQYTKKEKTKESMLTYFWLFAFIAIGVSSVYVLRGRMRNQPPPAPNKIAAAALPDKKDSANIPADQQPIVTPSDAETTPHHTAVTTKPATATTATPAVPRPPLSPADSIARAKAAALKAQQRKATADSLHKAAALQKQDSLRKAKEAEDKKAEQKKTEQKPPEPKPEPKQEEKKPDPPKKETPAPEPTNSDEYLYKAAMVYQQQGNLSEAIDRYRRIESVSSGKYVEMARYQLAICYRSKGQMGKARRMFREVIRMDGSLKNSAQQALDSM
ncbi:hypothetical protein ECE50_011735 [Chitinophaga sp. Mgbs1]|uniref:Uncharacterized protein n=1 Tax=Chitinophaga solisilvae TaxID=1233460 RepID=A0A433WK31_9BACT|nr:hypothetical protein [Chitinophaga solisilvae]